jgi:hypothetical protein
VFVFVIAKYWQNLRAAMFESYRPELHYMRGPVPKCREKRGR